MATGKDFPQHILKIPVDEEFAKLARGNLETIKVILRDASGVTRMGTPSSPGAELADGGPIAVLNGILTFEQFAAAYLDESRGHTLDVVLAGLPLAIKQAPTVKLFTTHKQIHVVMGRSLKLFKHQHPEAEEVSVDFVDDPLGFRTKTDVKVTAMTLQHIMEVYCDPNDYKVWDHIEELVWKCRLKCLHRDDDFFFVRSDAVASFIRNHSGVEELSISQVIEACTGSERRYRERNSNPMTSEEEQMMSVRKAIRSIPPKTA